MPDLPNLPVLRVVSMRKTGYFPRLSARDCRPYFRRNRHARF
jgi:hypothetical protein